MKKDKVKQYRKKEEDTKTKVNKGENGMKTNAEEIQRMKSKIKRKKERSWSSG